MSSFTKNQKSVWFFPQNKEFSTSVYIFSYIGVRIKENGNINSAIAEYLLPGLQSLLHVNKGNFYHQQWF